MRHIFLLDDNILYFAIRGIDRHNRSDETAARLIQTIVKVCHSLVIHNEIMGRYIKILHKLRNERTTHMSPTYLFRQLLNRAEKRVLQYDDLPTLPLGCNIPRKDEYLVQAALISRPLLVTADEPLYNALKDHPELGIEVFWPHEALEKAKEQ